MTGGSDAREAGWTLIELIVAMLLLSMLTALLANAIGGARQSFASLEQRTAEARSEAVQLHLRRAISEAMPVRSAGQATGEPLVTASAQRLRFVSGFSPAGQLNGLYTVDLFVRPRQSGATSDLVVVRTPFQSADAPEAAAAPGATSILMPGIAGVRMRYFGSLERQPPTWHEAWPEPNRLPALVSIEMLFGRGDRRTWPTLVIAVPTGQ
jgi:type II secretory pathway pseudopilin PulG